MVYEGLERKGGKTKKTTHHVPTEGKTVEAIFEAFAQIADTLIEFDERIGALETKYAKNKD